MQKLTSLTLLFALLFASCTTDTTSDIIAGGKGKTIIIEASFEGARTSLTDNGNGGEVAWGADDSISAITTSGKVSECKMLNCHNGIATFEVPEDIKYAVYPHSAATSYNTTSGLITFTLASEKSLSGTAEVFTDGENPMVGVYNIGEGVIFRHLCGYIELNLKGSQKVYNITIRNAADNGDALIGAYNIDLSSPASPVLKSATLPATSNSIQGVVDEAQLSTSKATPFYFVVPPRTYGNLEFVVRTSAGFYTLTSNNDIVVNRAKIRPIEAINLDTLTPEAATLEGSGTSADPFLIKNVDDLLEFATIATMSGGTPDLSKAYYALGASIDMKGITFNPIASFGGTLNGRGYTISNLTVTPVSTTPTAIFNKIEGATIQNLNLTNYSVAVTNSAQPCTASIAGEAFNSTISGCNIKGDISSETQCQYRSINSTAFVGGVAAYCENTNITNCTFEGTVTANKGQYVSGIAAYLNGGKISGCEVKPNSSVLSKMNCIGGIAGCVTSNGSVEDCVFEGKLTAYAYNGGIVGEFISGSIDGCVATSNAEIIGHYNITGVSYVATGGIVGRLITPNNAATTVSISNSASYASVEASVAVGGIVGAIHNRHASSKVYVTNCFARGTVTARSKNSFDYGVAGGVVGWFNQTGTGYSYITNCASVLDAMKFSSSATEAGFGGILAYLGDKGTTSIAYSTLTATDIVSKEEMKPVTSYSITHYGSIYGYTKGSANNCTYSYCYYPNTTANGMGFENATPTKNNCEAVSVAAMTDGTLLGKLNSAVAAYSGTLPTELAQWVSTSDGYPMPATVPADATNVTTRVSIIGDSISTYDGWLTSGYRTYYPRGTVTSVTMTYWYKLINNLMSNAKLDTNGSWTGSTVTRCTNTSYSSNHWYGHDFGARVLADGLGKPDVIIFFGGTNDSNNVGGTVLYTGYSASNDTSTTIPDDSTFATLLATADAATDLTAVKALDDTTFIPAYIKMIRILHVMYPKAKIIMPIGDHVRPALRSSILKIGAHYQAKYGYRVVDLQNLSPFKKNTVITKTDSCHPDDNGFTQMANYIYQQVGDYID